MMRTYRYLQLSAICIMIVSGLHAALAPSAINGFKTEADISLTAKIAALGMGFAVGTAEQTAAFASFVSLMDNATYPALPCALYAAHWAGVTTFAFNLMDSSKRKLDELQSSERSFMPVMTKIGYGRIYKPEELHNFFHDNYVRLYKGEHMVPLQGSPPLLDPVDISAAYNDVLEQRVKMLHFWGGVLITAVAGPIFGASGTVVLHNLGVLNPSPELD